jgi:2-dehydro-3-deoxyphosphooctonate aldolase (KDO 8-P synthase)
VRSKEGLPAAEALAILPRVKRELGVPILTDVHDEHEVEAAAEVADALQIPAFLSRQTALLQAAARTGRAVNVKKGQFLAPEDMKNAIEKLAAAGCDRMLLTERGTTFGYGDLVVDMRGLVVMRRLGWPVVYDATHSLQQPGGESSGGRREFAFPLMRAAVACGIDGLFFETHPDPARAWSDAATQLPLADAAPFLDEARRVHEAVANVRETVSR